MPASRRACKSRPARSARYPQSERSRQRGISFGGSLRRAPLHVGPKVALSATGRCYPPSSAAGADWSWISAKRSLPVSSRLLHSDRPVRPGLAARSHLSAIQRRAHPEERTGRGPEAVNWVCCTSWASTWSEYTLLAPYVSARFAWGSWWSARKSWVLFVSA